MEGAERLRWVVEAVDAAVKTGVMEDGMIGFEGEGGGMGGGLKEVGGGKDVEGKVGSANALMDDKAGKDVVGGGGKVGPEDGGGVAEGVPLKVGGKVGVGLGEGIAPGGVGKIVGG